MAWSTARAGPSAVTIHVSGYSYAPFVSTSQPVVSDVELDASGNIYICQPGSIRRVTLGGAMSIWSTASALDLVFSSTGEAFAAGGPQCNYCVMSITASGIASPLHSDLNTWRWLAINASGTLYAAASRALAVPPSGDALYTIDRVTGEPSLVVDGGPGPGGEGVYTGLAIGIDEILYATGNVDGTPTSWGVFRLDGAGFTKVGSWPHAGFGLAQDNLGVFYSVTSVERSDGTTGHEVWMFDQITQSSTLLADGPRGSSALAYDRSRDLLYVGDSSGNVYTIAKVPVSTRKESWSALKARYR
jgi:hypothetical protein